MEDARRVWIYSVVPDCLADPPRDGALRDLVRRPCSFLGLGEDALDLKRGNSLVLLVQLYSWHAEYASELKPGGGWEGRSIKRIRGGCHLIDCATEA